jgi:NDP-sugar pyrophosphorylase family protein
MIEHVISMFPGDHEFLFICNKEHIANTDLKHVLSRLKPKSKIITVDPHKKGPVFSIFLAESEIQDEEPILISYCDFYMDWDFSEFQEKMRTGNWAGAIPCLKGFHPNLLHGKFFAGVLADGQNKMVDIREKHSFTPKLTDSHQSTGVYYFHRGADLKRYTRELIGQNCNLNGEFYASMIFYLYKRDGLPVYVPEAKRFIAMGTPEDLEEFESWMRLLAKEFNIKILGTDVPGEREEKVKIPWLENSSEYDQCKNYWLNYLSSLSAINMESRERINKLAYG